MQDNLKGVVTTFLYQANRGEGLPFENGDFRMLVNEVWHRKFHFQHSHHEKLPHIHNILEVRMILTGECAMQLDNRKVMLLKPGDFMIFPEGTQHCVMSESDGFAKCGLECTFIPKDTEIGRLYALLLERLKENPKVYHFSKRAAQLMEQLLSLFDNPGLDYETNILFLAASLPMDLLTAAASQIDWLYLHLEPRVEKAMKVINDTVTAHTGAAQVAEKVGLSVRQLDRLFMAELGETVNGAIARVRQRKIRGLLLDPAVSLKEIVQILEYNDMTAFVRAFKRVEGMTPTQFRKAMKVEP